MEQHEIIFYMENLVNGICGRNVTLLKAELIAPQSQTFRASIRNAESGKVWTFDIPFSQVKIISNLEKITDINH